MKAVKLRSVVVLGWTRWWSHNRSEDVVRGATALGEETVRLKYLSVHLAALARGFVFIALITLAGGNAAHVQGSRSLVGFIS